MEGQLCCQGGLRAAFPTGGGATEAQIVVSQRGGDTRTYRAHEGDAQAGGGDLAVGVSRQLFLD